MAEINSSRIFRLLLRRNKITAKIISVGKPFGLNVSNTEPGKRKIQKRLVSSHLVFICAAKKAVTSIRPAVNGMSCQRVIPMAYTTGVLTIRSELIAANFLLETEYAKLVTLYVKTRPLNSVKSGIAFPRKEK